MDDTDWEFIEQIRLHGRLPGNGALGAFDEQDTTAPIIEPLDVVAGDSKGPERRSRKAYRIKSSYFNNAELVRLREVWARNDAAEAERAAREKARAKKRLDDQKRAAWELQRERKRWREEMRRWHLREERWRSEQHLWDDVEATTKERRAEKLEQMRREVEEREEQAKLAKERQARRSPDWLWEPINNDGRAAAQAAVDTALVARKRRILERVRDQVKERCDEANLNEAETRAIQIKILTGVAETLDSVPYMHWDEINWAQF